MTGQTQGLEGQGRQQHCTLASCVNLTVSVSPFLNANSASLSGSPCTPACERVIHMYILGKSGQLKIELLWGCMALPGTAETLKAASRRYKRRPQHLMRCGAPCNMY